MVSSIGSSDDSMMQLLMSQLNSKMNAADTDGTSGLSKAELSSIDAGDDAGGAAFLKSLTAQFGNLDADGNGQLSATEIAKVKPIQEQMGPPPGMMPIQSSDDDSKNSFSSLVDTLAQAAYDTFDTNEDGKVSLDELKAAYGNDNSSASAMNDIIKNYENYDTNKDGTLSSDEFATAIQDAVKNNGADAVKTATSSESGNMGDSLKNMAGSFLQKLIDTYKDGGFNDIASSLSSVI